MAQAAQPSRPKRATLATIAETAGVSRQVVSAILGVSVRGNVRFGAATRDRVLEIARGSGFRVNRTAKNLVNKRHGAIGILVANFGNVNEAVLREVLFESHRRGHVIVLDIVDVEEGELPLCLREDSVDGLLTFQDLGRRVQREISRVGIPCVRVNTNIRSLPGCITYDEAGAMRMAAEHFARFGRQQLAILAEPSGHYSMRQRIEGLRRAARDLGLDPPRVHSLGAGRRGSAANDDGVAGLARWLGANGDVDGLVLAVDTMAPVLYRVAHMLDIRIPDDLAVVGVNNSAIAWAVLPSLTSLCIEPRQVARETTVLLDELIAGGLRRHAPVKLPYTIVVRESSTAPPSRREPRETLSKTRAGDGACRPDPSRSRSVKPARGTAGALSAAEVP